MEIRFLGQGHEVESAQPVGDVLRHFLNDPNYHVITILTAFSSEAGVNGLERILLNSPGNIHQVFIVTGVDQKGTSKEALESLLKMGVDAYVYYQPSRTIFHPKIYLFEGENMTSLIIGSSNLTVQGLISNVESSILITIENNAKKDYQLILELKSYYKSIFDRSDPNLQRLTRELIDHLIETKIVPGEKERQLVQDKEDNPIPQDALDLLYKYFPKRQGAKVPPGFRAGRKDIPLSDSIPEEFAEPLEALTEIPVEPKEDMGQQITDDYQLVWNSGGLTERDLNIPSGLNTHATGSMFFKKGQTPNIDQRHYFRDEVFAELDWNADANPSTAHIERANALFSIWIEGKDLGIYSLRISHNTKTDSRAYQQNNSMTQLSWGAAKEIIGKPELIGKIAKLFKSSDPAKSFILAID